MNRFAVLSDLVAFRRPINAILDNLSNFDWDYEGEPMIVRASQIQDVLKRFIAGEFTAKELESWANLIEFREDLEFEKIHYEAIENVINCLANPILQGEITTILCKVLLSSLD